MDEPKQTKQFLSSLDASFIFLGRANAGRVDDGVDGTTYVRR